MKLASLFFSASIIIFTAFIGCEERKRWYQIRL